MKTKIHVYDYIKTVFTIAKAANGLQLHELATYKEINLASAAHTGSFVSIHKPMVTQTGQTKPCIANTIKQGAGGLCNPGLKPCNNYAFVHDAVRTYIESVYVAMKIGHMATLPCRCVSQQSALQPIG